VVAALAELLQQPALLVAARLEYLEELRGRRSLTPSVKFPLPRSV
jgi:hypothetical protein